MKLFFKHLLRCIKKSPLQPVVLLFTLILSFALCVSCFSTRAALTEEEKISVKETLGDADLKISLSSSTASRFIFEDEIKDILGENIRSTGHYDLIVSLDSKEMSFAAAVDFSEISNFFSFEFSEYSAPTKSEVASTIFVTRSFAKEHGLSLGSNIRLSLFGESRAYTVKGISEKPFLSEYDTLVDIGGVVRLVAGESAFAPILDDSFKPFSTLYVILPEGMDAEAAAELLRQSDAFSSRRVEVAKNISSGVASADVLNLTIDFCVILSCILASAVCFCCFSILSSERAEENTVFSLAGAKPSLLNSLQYAEILMYWAIGAVPGILLAIPLNFIIGSYSGLRFAYPEITLSSVFISLFILLCSMLMTATLFVLTKGRKAKLLSSRAALLLALLPSIFLYATVFILPRRTKLPFGIISVAVLIFLLFLVSGPAFSALAYISSKKAEKTQRPVSAYALKNLHSLKSLHNTSRLCAVITCIIICISLLLIGGNKNLSLSREIFSEEYAVISATERCEKKMLEADSVASLERVLFIPGSEQASGTVNLISVSSADILGENLNVKELPENDGAILSLDNARALSVGIGDSIVIRVEEKDLSLRVENIIRSPYSYILFDAQHFGISYNMLLPSAKGGVQMSEFAEEISLIAATEAAAVVQTAELFEEKTVVIGIYLSCARLLLSMISIFAFVGLFDNLYESYRSRREEFKLYCLAGMTDREIKKMKLSEISLCLIWGVISGVIFAAVILPMLNNTLLSRNFDLISNLIA